ncbi:MAG: DegT/DnrJ/EryC1/StrS family aminotransferase [Nanoarchaeota archaeon]
MKEQNNAWPIITKEEAIEISKLLTKRELSVSAGKGIIGEFEKNFADYNKTKYVLAQNNGTSTLHAAFFALGLKSGDEILVPSYTWHASITPALHIGLRPVFCDIDKETLNIDAKDLYSRITSRTKAIVIVHLWGLPVDMDPIIKIAKENNLYIIEDCSHAAGAEYKSKKVGTFGDIACFSMQASKPLVAGEGGIFATNDQQFYERAILLGHPSRLKNTSFKKYGNCSLGWKYRANPLSIAIANVQLKYLDKRNQITRKNMRYLTKGLAEIKGLVLPFESKISRRIYYSYRLQYDKQIIGKSKYQLIDHLQKKGLKAEDEDFTLLHKSRLFLDYPAFFDYLKELPDNYQLPTAESVYPKLMSLPVVHSENKDVLDKLINLIHEFTKNA